MSDQESGAKLRKHEELAVDLDNPWGDDHLDRANAAQVLGRVLLTIEQPFVVALNSPFGTGKSFFTKRLLQQFRNEGQIALYFNAWEKDNQGQPMLSFVGSLLNQLSEHYGVTKSSPTMKSLAKRAGSLVLRKALPSAARILTMGLISDEDIQEVGQVGNELISGSGSIAEGLVESQMAAEVAFSDFRQELESAATAALEVAGAPAKAIYVFVDELDRCRPPYALELLENIKHLFSVPGLVFVLAIDREHLKNSISTIYGAGMDSEGYLARFIDQNYRLPQPSAEAYSNYLFEKFALKEGMKNRKGHREEGKEIVRHFSELSEIFGLSLRVQEQAFAEINFIIRNTTPKRALFSPLLGQLAALKKYDQSVYEDYCTGRITWNELASIIAEGPNGEKWLLDKSSVFSRAWLVVGNQNDIQSLHNVSSTAGDRINELMKGSAYSDEMRREEKELEAKRELYSKAANIASELSNEYDMFVTNRGKSPASYLYSDFGLALEFSGK